MNNFIDMTGWKMCEHGVPDSKWTVISYSGNSKWYCRCSCGTEKDVAGSSLRKGVSKSCGKCRTKAPNFIDETGNVYGRLTVIREDGMDISKHKKWLCQCSCGKIVSVLGKNLRNGKTQSCGCYRAEQRTKHNFKNLFNMKFGKLTAAECIGKDEANQFLWKCQCDCGGFAVVTAHALLSGNTTSCGCIKSKGEERIGQILKELNINFEKEYSFDDLKNINPLRFDFCIKKKDNTIDYLIEYQGIQHYEQDNKWYSELNQEKDQKKRDYCKAHKINLIEISYKDFSKLNADYIKERIEDGRIY